MCAASLNSGMTTVTSGVSPLIGRSQLFRNYGIAWRCGPQLTSVDFPPWIEQVITTGAFDHVLPLTERCLYRLWELAPAWRDRVFPATEEWQRALLRDKFRMSEH